MSLWYHNKSTSVGKTFSYLEELVRSARSSATEAVQTSDATLKGGQVSRLEATRMQSTTARSKL